MFKNYLKITVRNIRRHKGYSFLNLAGLSVGMACFILILLFVQYEFSFNAQHVLGDRVYRVNVTQKHPNGAFTTQATMVPLGPAVSAEVPEIENFARLYNLNKVVVKFEDASFLENNLVFTDPGLFKMFRIPLQQGDSVTALQNKFSVVLTREMAEKYFGGTNPIGRMLMIDGNPFTVTGICANHPRNTSIRPDFMLSFATLQELAGERFMNNWISTELTTYLMLNQHGTQDEAEARINAVLARQGISEVPRELHLEAFNRIYLYSGISGSPAIKYVYMFLAIGILILLIGSINFMNLSTARSINRAKEVGLRKVSGATRSQLISQFFGESIILSVIALMLGLLIAANLLPLFTRLTQQPLGFPGFSQWPLYLVLLGITLLVGILSGTYPAVVLSAFRPATVLKSSVKSAKGNGTFRKILVFVQFSIAIVLIICTLVISGQLQFLHQKDLGFRKDQIVVLPVQRISYSERVVPLRQVLEQNHSVISTSASMLLPSRIGNYNNVTWEGAAENEGIAIIQNKVDYDFLDTYEIQLIRGRNFNREHVSDLLDYSREQVGAALINEEAMRRFGWTDPVGKKLIQTMGENRYPFNVIGVFSDFHFASLHHEIRPLYLMLRPENARYLAVKTRPENIGETLAWIEDSWHKINPDYPFEYSFLSASFEQFYHSEENMQRLFKYFSILAILISCLGLFGLAAYSAEQRTKEIGVRKVMGASVAGLAALLGVEFTRWVLMANLLAWPVAWYVMDLWLSNFAYRIDLNGWLFLISGGMALGIALVTVSWQAIRAANANPVESLRYE